MIRRGRAAFSELGTIGAALSETGTRGILGVHGLRRALAAFVQGGLRMSEARTRFIGGFPERGIWTPLDLGRGQFFAILGCSLLVFVLAGGPVWRHVGDPHTLRIATSYAVIPPAVWAARRRNGASGAIGTAVAAAVVAAIKLVVTAGLLLLLGLARA